MRYSALANVIDRYHSVALVSESKECVELPLR